MPLIQVTSGGQRSLLKKKLQVCESQQSCLFVVDQILIFHHNLQINSLKILQCDFLDFFSYFVSHSWGIPMMKITDLSHLFKWENLHNWWLTKYFFAPLYIAIFFSFYCLFMCNLPQLSHLSALSSRNVYQTWLAERYHVGWLHSHAIGLCVSTTTTVKTTTAAPMK